MPRPAESPSTSELPRGAVAVITRADRFLVIRRSASVAAPRAFCFPGGHVEPGETESEALVRELREELGVLAQPIRRVWQSQTRWRVELSWWLTEVDPAAALLPNAAEVESVHWLAPPEILALPELLDSNRDFLSLVAAGQIVLSSHERG